MPHGCLKIQAGASQMDVVNEDPSGPTCKCQCRIKIRFPCETCLK